MSETLTEFIIPGVLLGAMAAFSPGPLMALLVSETLQHGVKSGIKIAIAPLFTDIPFIIAALLLAKGLQSSDSILGLIGCLGAIVLMYFAIENLRTKREDFKFKKTSKDQSLTKGIVVNLLNPHMYVYWFSIVTPIFARGTLLQNGSFSLAFVGTFSGIMMIMAFMISKVRSRFFDYAHWILKGLGLILIFFAYKLGVNGLELLKII